MVPHRYRVADRRVETYDTVTLALRPVDPALPPFRPGQFSMLYAFGLGEVPISVSGIPSTVDGDLVHTVRAVGAVSQALHDAGPGTVLGVRGPFGTEWEPADTTGQDLLILAGGVGLAPVRPLVLHALVNRAWYGRVTLVTGARTPQDLLYRDELARWTADERLDVRVTIDRPAPGWDGPVGFVTEPLARLDLDPRRTVAFVCGPEPMMAGCAAQLTDRGVPADRIRLSLERNMKCGVGLCGHCQLGPWLLCRDGPVVGYDQAAPLLAVPEL
jgi:NAD(P)H-flavin reductase